MQQGAKDLSQAYDNYFAKNADHPTKNRKGIHETFRYPQHFKVDQNNTRVFLPKIGWVRYRASREIVGKPQNVTISFFNGHWHLSIQTKRVVADPQHSSTTIVGIDLGVANIVALSDGTLIPPVNSFKKYQKKLAIQQKRMSHKVKFSKNWYKERRKVQKIHGKIANTRRDHIHKLSTTISKTHAVVCIEALKVKNMTHSARGTCEKPGVNVKQKSGLNRAILDQGWGELRRQLGYKLKWRGGILLQVPHQHTSQTCLECHYVSPENRISQSEFVCKACGYTNHADVVGAMNVLERGHRLLACGESVHEGRSMKQEPTEVDLAVTG